LSNCRLFYVRINEILPLKSCSSHLIKAKFPEPRSTESSSLMLLIFRKLHRPKGSGIRYGDRRFRFLGFLKWDLLRYARLCDEKWIPEVRKSVCKPESATIFVEAERVELLGKWGLIRYSYLGNSYSLVGRRHQIGITLFVVLIPKRK